MYCTKCGMKVVELFTDNAGNQCCNDCKHDKPTYPIFNNKGFLVPTSILSMSSYHAKVFEDGTYIFRIHDCNNGIRLRGELTSTTGISEALSKSLALENALREFRLFIEKNYQDTVFP